MFQSTVTVHVLLVLLSAIGASVIGGYARRNQRNQNVLPLLVLIAAFAMGSGLHLIGLLVTLSGGG